MFWVNQLNRYFSQLAITYGLYLLECACRLSVPIFLGQAINEAFSGNVYGICIWLAASFMLCCISFIRRLYDTRSFTTIHQDIACQVSTSGMQNELPTSVSKRVAHVSLTRELVEFLERDFLATTGVFINLLGSFFALAFWGWRLAGILMIFGCVTAITNYVFARIASRLNSNLNSLIETEAEVVASNDIEKANHFFLNSRLLRIQLSDCLAHSGAVVEFCGIVAGAALLLVLLETNPAPGDFLAVFRYFSIFVIGLRSLAPTTNQIIRLLDIGKRIQYTIGHEGNRVKNGAHKFKLES